MDPVVAAATLRLLRRVLPVAVAAMCVGTLLLIVIFAGGAGGAGGGISAQTVSACAADPTGTVPADPGASAPTTVDAEQGENARIIVQIGQEMGMAQKAQVIAVTAAYTESSLRNVPGGDRDSVGLFQMRASWGTYEQRHDPAWASQKFYTVLKQVPGWEVLPVAQDAQAVERSAFPDRYAPNVALAETLVGLTPGATGAAQDGPCAPLSGCPPVSPEQERNLTPDALAVLRCGVAQFQIVSTVGWAVGGHLSESAHYTGRAVDFMVGDDTAKGDALAAWAYANRAEFGITEIIWNATIRTAAQGWTVRPYTSPDGATDPTSLHRDHVHVTVSGNAGTYGTTGQVNGPVVLPVAGAYVLTAGFGDCGTHWANCHTGQDFAVPVGTPVRAIAAGVVTFTGWSGPYGNLAKVDHGGGVESWYAHLSAFVVRAGRVTPGQVIAFSGATGNVTGPHVHLEVRLDGTPVDPLPWLASHGAPAA